MPPVDTSSVKISIHALLAESDGLITSNGTKKLNFYPRSPCGERRHLSMCNTSQRVFLSTLSLRRATLTLARMLSRLLISIHALLAESDRNANYNCHNVRPISIHALLAESDPPRVIREPTTRHFYPRSPCGERQQTKALKVSPLCISIHALLAESDQLYINRTAKAIIFLSTLSLRRATVGQKRLRQKLAISIHALLAESDERANRLAHAPPQISIHALLAESDTAQ